MAWDRDASMDATKQTAAGDGFEELGADPLDFGDLGLFGLFERLELRDPFLFEFLLFFSYSWNHHLLIGQEWLVLAYQLNPHEGNCTRPRGHTGLVSKTYKFFCLSSWENPDGQLSDPCLTRLRTLVFWLWGFMLVCAVVLTTAPFIPGHTVPLWNEACLALDCWSRGATGT